MKGNLLLGTVYVSPINSCVYNSVNGRDWGRSTINLGTVLLGTVSPINSCVYDSVNDRISAIVDGIC